ncbi:MAG: phage tail assembly chaperone G [Christensenellales bacterium]
MVTCTLGDKKYSVDFISGRALREMEPASKMYGKLVALSKAAVEGQDLSDEKLTIPEALDTMVKWFCILFGGQFSPDDVYDHYPSDRLMHDIALAIMAVQTQTTEVLDSFPTKPVAQEAQKILENQET